MICLICGVIPGRGPLISGLPEISTFSAQVGNSRLGWAESPESSNHWRRLLDSGFAARSQVYAGCASLPASAPRNDKFHGIDQLGGICVRMRQLPESFAYSLQRGKSHGDPRALFILSKIIRRLRNAARSPCSHCASAAASIRASWTPRACAEPVPFRPLW